MAFYEWRVIYRIFGPICQQKIHFGMNTYNNGIGKGNIYVNIDYLCLHICSLLTKVIYVSIGYNHVDLHVQCWHRWSMSAYIFYVGIYFLCQHMFSMSAIRHTCQHRLSMLAYIFNVGIVDLCQHKLYMLTYIFNVGIGDLCQNRLNIWWHTYSMWHRWSMSA